MFKVSRISCICYLGECTAETSLPGATVYSRVAGSTIAVYAVILGELSLCMFFDDDKAAADAHSVLAGLPGDLSLAAFDAAVEAIAAARK